MQSEVANPQQATARWRAPIGLQASEHRRHGYFFSTFQNTVTGEATLPLTVLRRASG